MGKISDEIRKAADEYDVLPLYKLADRIDNEMVELPRDRDGVPIHVGDTVYLDDGRKSKVTSIGIEIGEDSIYTIVQGYDFTHTPGYVSHERPDSFERIADELDEMVETADAGTSVYDTCERLSNFADRIRKLAKEQGDE